MPTGVTILKMAYEPRRGGSRVYFYADEEQVVAPWWSRVTFHGQPEGIADDYILEEVCLLCDQPNAHPHHTDLRLLGVVVQVRGKWLAFIHLPTST
jgi:hypothetical protein